MSRIAQRGQGDHPENPGGTGGKWLEGGEASRAQGVEKPAARSDAPESGVCVAAERKTGKLDCDVG